MVELAGVELQVLVELVGLVAGDDGFGGFGGRYAVDVWRGGAGELRFHVGRRRDDVGDVRFVDGLVDVGGFGR